MLIRPAPTQIWNIVLLSCRDPSTDFRLPLARALHALGHRVLHVHVKRRPVLTDLGGPAVTREFSAMGFVSHARAIVSGAEPLVFFNSTNLRFPLFSGALRFLCGGLWCFDMHDDLLYDSTGFTRAKAVIAQHLLLSGSDISVHAAPALKQLFPASLHLGNASSIPRLARAHDEVTRLLILTSIDRRLDFDLLASTARATSGIAFDIHGALAGNDDSVRLQLNRLLADNPNIHYYGPYENKDLPSILAAYSVMFAPYRLSPLTACIDPLRYYHGINSGLEVVSTPIPRALELRHAIHLVDDTAAAASRIRGLADRSAPRLNAEPGIRLADWDDKAQALIDILARHHRDTVA